MRRFIPIALFGLVISAAPLLAQEDSPVPMLRAWYTKYLGREIEPSGTNYWVDQLNNGASLLDVEAGILGSDEYFKKVGSSRAGFVRGLFNDVLRRKPTMGELRYWTGRIESNPYTTVAAEFLLKYRK